MKNYYWIILALGSLLMMACSATRVVRPLQKGEVRIGADVGGPIVAGSTLIPLTSLSTAYGMTENVSLYGGIHTTSLAYGTLHLDVGANVGLTQPKGIVPGLSSNLNLYPAVSLRDGAFRLYPDVTFNAYWEINDKNVPYIGWTSFFDFFQGQTDLGKGLFYHPGIQAGYNYEGRRFIFGGEFRILNPGRGLELPEAEINSIGGTGGYGIYLKLGIRLNTGS